MAFNSTTTPADLGRSMPLPPSAAETAPATASAVSWGAIAAGAAAAAALSLILLMLGVGLGLSSVSPWARDGASAVTFGISTIVWLTVTQLLASAIGGYLAGRLRTRWVAAAADEVYFRDTAHGFLAWAIASLATAALLTTAIGSIVGTGLQAGATVSAGAATAAVDAVKGESSDGPMAYYLDALFRKDGAATDPARGSSATEVGRIFLNTPEGTKLGADDARHVAQLVALGTGLSQADAEKRVTDTHARWQTQLQDARTAAKVATDKARKASAHTALWLFISLLIGAFVASLSATYGGRQRDL